VPSSYAGKTVAVTGAASGIGRATAEMLAQQGASVWSLDVNRSDVGEAVLLDLRDPTSIQQAAERIGSPLHALFNCAGIPHGPRFDPVDVVTVNFVGLRHLTELVVPRMPAGGAIVNVASVAGERWKEYCDDLAELMGITDWDDAVEWCRLHPELVSATNCYNFSKQAVIFYTMWRCGDLARSGQRINSIAPGPTDTGMTPLFVEARGPEFYDNLRDRLGRNSTPEEQARPLLFLNSDDASYVTGTTLFTDLGMTAMLSTGQLHRDQLRASS
jgi:NAD(P)-dependent dehydrogenase (short-subunit alcohol dehydrogenase family)